MAPQWPRRPLPFCHPGGLEEGEDVGPNGAGYADPLALTTNEACKDDDEDEDDGEQDGGNGDDGEDGEDDGDEEDGGQDGGAEATVNKMVEMETMEEKG